MFDVLVYVYEHFWRGDACPELQQLQRRLSAHGFEPDEINDALTWLDGLNVATQSAAATEEFPQFAAIAPSEGSMRVHSVAEQQHLGAESLGFISFLASSGVLPGSMCAPPIPTCLRWVNTGHRVNFPFSSNTLK